MASGTDALRNLMYGNDIISGMVRFLAAIAVYILLFGTLFWWVGRA